MELEKAEKLIRSLPEHGEYKNGWADKAAAARKLLEQRFPKAEYHVSVRLHKRKGVEQGFFYNVTKNQV